MLTGLRLKTSVSCWMTSAWPMFVSLILFVSPGSRSPDRLQGPTIVNKLLLLFISLARWVKTFWWARLEVIQEMRPPVLPPHCRSLCSVISAAPSVRESFCFMQKTIQDDTQQPSARTDCWIKGTNLINWVNNFSHPHASCHINVVKLWLSLSFRSMM